MAALRDEIIRKIRTGGPISFETFMEMCLYHPSLGYYTKKSARIGRAGDFYTSPHLHPIFGAMLGRQLEEMWEFMGRPRRFQAVEMGAGMGYLAKDILGYLKDRDIFACLSYTIVEMNPWMIAGQDELLGEFSLKTAWVSRLKDLPAVFGCVFSNELLDAFPVRLIEQDDMLSEIYVSLDRDDNFTEIRVPCAREVTDYLREFSIELPQGYRTEVNLGIREWLTGVDKVLSEGFILTIDYGYSSREYYADERNRGTLLSYYRHQVHEDPYKDPGEQDLTAHVNFSSLMRWGDELGLRAIGYCPQGTYLISLGIDRMLTERYGDSPDRFEIAKVKGLLFPQGMGESHRVMVQYKGEGTPVLKGFTLRNQVKYL